MAVSAYKRKKSYGILNLKLTYEIFIQTQSGTGLRYVSSVSI